MRVYKQQTIFSCCYCGEISILIYIYMKSTDSFPRAMNFFGGLELYIFLFSHYIVFLFFQPSYKDVKVKST